MSDEKEKKKELLEEQEKLVTEEHKLLKETDSQRVQDLENTLKRLQADFDNFRKRYEKEKQEFSQYASASFIIKLLPVIDELEHSMQEAKKHHAKEAAALEVLYKHLVKLLEAEGIREMKCESEGFDPYKHDAIKRETNELPEGKICKVLKKGYYFHDRVLRHAMVIVSSGKKDEKIEQKIKE